MLIGKPAETEIAGTTVSNKNPYLFGPGQESGLNFQYR